MKSITEKQSGASMQGYRTGARQEDKNRIRQMSADGKSVDEISRALLIEKDCVQSFVDHFSGNMRDKKSDAPVKRRQRRVRPQGQQDQESSEKESADESK